jgi:hypothetical protein
MATSDFWAMPSVEPKRRYRFQISIPDTNGTGNIPAWTVKTATKPKVTVSVIEHSYLDHVFKYPGRVTWDNITLTLVDPVDPDIGYTLLNRLGLAGYKYPEKPEGLKAMMSLSKGGMASVLTGLALQQIDGAGNIIEQWTLKNPTIASIDFGGSLDYTSDEMNEITLELAYDWAEMTLGKPVAGAAATDTKTSKLSVWTDRVAVPLGKTTSPTVPTT